MNFQRYNRLAIAATTHCLQLHMAARHIHEVGFGGRRMLHDIEVAIGRVLDTPSFIPSPHVMRDAGAMPNAAPDYWPSPLEHGYYFSAPADKLGTGFRIVFNPPRRFAVIPA
jgi:hypothetical protein